MSEHPPPTGWQLAHITARTDWTADLFSVQFDAPNLGPFKAGQFIRLGLDLQGERVGRAFSLVNAPTKKPHEIVAVRVAQGLFSPALHALKIGDPVWHMPSPTGFFTLDECPAADTLWLIATGTGLGPYLSMLEDDSTWARYRQVVLVHGTRTVAEQCYLAQLNTLASARPLRLVHIASREQEKVRLTQAFEKGLLEAKAGREMTAADHVLLCGNPEMIKEMQALLLARGLKKHRRREPGQVTTENYWN